MPCTHPNTLIFHYFTLFSSCVADFAYVLDDIRYISRDCTSMINSHFWTDSDIFSLCIFLDWSAIKTLTSSPFSTPLFPTSPSSLRSLFGLQWNFDVRPLLRYRELNMPCPDLLSAATFIPLASNAALKPSENALFSWKTHHPDLSAGACQFVVFLLYFGSALLIFSLVCLWLWPCSRVKANYYWPLKAPGSLCLNLFFKDTLFSFVWTDVKKARKQPSDLMIWYYFCLHWLVQTYFGRFLAGWWLEIFSDSIKQLTSRLD